jgi:hypothetical protein
MSPDVAAVDLRGGEIPLEQVGNLLVGRISHRGRDPPAAPHEIGRGCGFDVDFAGQKGTFIVWGSVRKQTDGFGNAVSPAVGEWIGSRLRAALHRDQHTLAAAH